MNLDARTLEQIRDHIATELHLVPLFNIAVLEATGEQASVGLGFGELTTRPEGSVVVGSVQFALADVAIYATKRGSATAMADLTINFLRPAMTIPLVATAMQLRAGCRPFTAEVRIVEETTTRLVARATGTDALSGNPA